MEAAHEERLPKLDPTGRAGVRAMKGPVRRLERREAPIQCGFARTYEADTETTTPFGTTTPLPAEPVSAPVEARSNRTFVQFRAHHGRREPVRAAPAAHVRWLRRSLGPRPSRSGPGDDPAPWSAVPMHRFQGGAAQDVV